MKLTQLQIDNLLSLVSRTRDTEINCNECLDLLAEFAEIRLKDQTLPSALESVEHHLTLCAECREEYEALRIGLQNMAPKPPPGE